MFKGGRLCALSGMEKSPTSIQRGMGMRLKKKGRRSFVGGMPWQLHGWMVESRVLRETSFLSWRTRVEEVPCFWRIRRGGVWGFSFLESCLISGTQALYHYNV